MTTESQTQDTDRDGEEESETNDYLYICPDCSVVCYHRMPECPACGSSEEKLTLAVVNEEGLS